MATIDFKNVDRAFQSLIDTKAGSEGLANFSRAIANLHDSLSPKINDHEFKYLLLNLVNQRRVGQTPATAAGEARVQNDFIIKAAVDAD